MKWLSLIFKNIKKFIQHKPFLFVFLIISQIICTIVIILVCGFVDNANRAVNVISEGEKEFSIYIGTNDLLVVDSKYHHIYTDGEGNYFYSDGTAISKEEMENLNNQKYPEGYYSNENLVKNIKKNIEEFIKFLGDDYGTISIYGLVDDTYGSYDFSSGYPIGDRDVSKEISDFYNSTENIIRLDPKYYTNESGDPIKIGDKMNLAGVEYTVKIIEEDVVALNIPYAALQDDFYVTSIQAWTKEICSPERCNEITEKVKEIFGDNKEMVSPKPRKLEELQNIQLAYGVTAAVIIMVLLNISRVYSYVLTYRKKSLAVMNICGASKGKVFSIYLIELLLTLIVTFGIGLLIFHTLLLQPIATIYPNFLISMTPLTYLTIFGIYFVIAALIMSITISMFISKSAVDMERSGD